MRLSDIYTLVMVLIVNTLISWMTQVLLETFIHCVNKLFYLFVFCTGDYGLPYDNQALLRVSARKLKPFSLFTPLNLCKAVLATSEISVCLFVCSSVRLSKAWIVAKRKKLAPTSLYRMKDVYSNFPTRRMITGDNLLFLKFWAKLIPFVTPGTWLYCYLSYCSPF